MMTRMMTFGLAAATAAAGLLATPSPASAKSDVQVIFNTDKSDMAPTRNRNGVPYLRPTDQEGTNEMASFGISTDGQRGVVVMMSSAKLLENGVATPANQNDEDQNVQGVCMPFTVTKDDTTETGIRMVPTTAEFKFITDRDGDEGRNFNIPEVVALQPDATSGMAYFAIEANYDRNNNTNTERYVQFVDMNCNLMQINNSNVGTIRENGTTVSVMAKNNDNCAGGQAGGSFEAWTLTEGNNVGFTRSAASDLCNGNGRDDGWIRVTDYQCTDLGCVVDKQGDVSYIQREERSRGKAVFVKEHNMIVACGTEGNNQPQREGVWCQGVDADDVDDVLWKEMVAYRGETEEGQRTYAMRIKMDQVHTIDNIGTGELAIQYQMHRGNNNGNKKGGYDDKICYSSAKPDRNALNFGPCQDITAAVISSGVEFTHATQFQTFIGSTDAPQAAFAYTSPNHRANSNFGAKVMNLSLTDGAVLPADMTQLQGPADGNLYSKYLGNNPNNQGRNYIQCETIANPFAAEPGKSQGIPVFNACAMTGKLTTTNLEPEYKPDMFFEVWSSLTPPDAGTPGDDDDPTGGDDDNNDDDSTDDDSTDDNDDGNGSNGSNGNDVGGGCSTAGGMGGSAAFLLIGLAFLGIRRRRN